jgi:HEAT repeat protein
MKQQARQWWQQAARMVQNAANQPSSFAQWVEQLATRDPSIAVPATWALQQAGAAVIPTLLMGLNHPHTRVRRACVDIIDHGGYGGDARCVTALLPLLSDPVPHIRRAVWHTLFCERCPDSTKCEITTPVQLDRVALLVEIGVHDPNPKLRQQLVGDLGDFLSDPRARQALERIVDTATDPRLLAVAQRVLVGGVHA